MSVKVQSYSFTEIGKTIKESKKKYSWKLLLNGNRYSIDLVACFITGKRVVYLNDWKIRKEQNASKFQMDFQLEESTVWLFQTTESAFDVQINDDLFSALWEVELNRKRNRINADELYRNAGLSSDTDEMGSPAHANTVHIFDSHKSKEEAKSMAKSDSDSLKTSQTSTKPTSSRLFGIGALLFGRGKSTSTEEEKHEPHEEKQLDKSIGSAKFSQEVHTEKSKSMEPEHSKIPQKGQQKSGIFSGIGSWIETKLVGSHTNSQLKKGVPEIELMDSLTNFNFDKNDELGDEESPIALYYSDYLKNSTEVLNSNHQPKDPELVIDKKVELTIEEKKKDHKISYPKITDKTGAPQGRFTNDQCKPFYEFRNPQSAELKFFQDLNGRDQEPKNLNEKHSDKIPVDLNDKTQEDRNLQQVDQKQETTTEPQNDMILMSTPQIKRSRVKRSQI